MVGGNPVPIQPPPSSMPPTMATLLARRDLMLARNADLEGDIHSLQYRSLAKRTSTIDIAMSPQEFPGTQLQSLEKDSLIEQPNQMYMYRQHYDTQPAGADSAKPRKHSQG